MQNRSFFRILQFPPPRFPDGTPAQDFMDLKEAQGVLVGVPLLLVRYCGIILIASQLIFLLFSNTILLT